MVYVYKIKDNRRKVLILFLEYPSKEFHIRQLSRLTNLNPNTIINITEEMMKEKLIVKSRPSDKPFSAIKPNKDYWLYKLKKFEYNVEKIYRGGLIDFLNKELSYPTIILFGSYAKAENHENSDIDFFIIADEKKELKLDVFSEKLNAEIQLFLHTKKEFQQLKIKNKELINNVINGYKLSGYLEAL